MIRYLFFLLFSICVYSQNNDTYTKIWGTYFGPQLSNFKDVIKDHEGNLVFFSPLPYSYNHIPRNYDYMNQFVTESEPRYQFNFQNFENRSSTFVAKFSPEGALLSCFYLPYLIDKIKLDSNNHYVFLGNIAQIPENMSSTWFNAPTNYDYFVGKLDARYNLIWYSKLPSFNANFVLDSDDSIYLVGRTTVNEGITNSNSFMQNFNSTTLNQNNAFLVKLTSSGAYVWSTYYGKAFFEDIKILNNELFVILNSNESDTIYATEDALFTIPSGSVFSKFNKLTGARTYSTYIKDLDNIMKLEVINNFIYILGTTSNNLDSSILNLNIYDQANLLFKSYLGKFTTDMMPVWGTYLVSNLPEGFIFYSNFVFHNNSIILEYEYDNSNIEIGFETLIENNSQLTIIENNGMGSIPSVYSIQNRIYTYDSNSLYIFGSSNSNTGIATPGSAQETISISPEYPFATHGNAVILNYKKTSSLNLENTTIKPIIIYPNPTKGSLYIEGNTTEINSVQIYNMLGQQVYKVQSTNIKSLDLNHLAKGIYTIQLNNLKTFYKISIN